MTHNQPLTGRVIATKVGRMGLTFADLSLATMGLTIVLALVSSESYVYVAALTAFLLLASYAAQKGSVRKITTEELLLSVFFIWVLMSTFWLADRPSGMAWSRAVALYGGVPLSYAVVSRLATTRRGWTFLAQCYLFGAILSMLLVLVNWRRGIIVPNTTYRYAYAGVNTNYIAYTLVSAIPILAVLLWTSQHRRRLVHALGFLLVPLIGFVVLLTGSRGAAFAFLLALLVFALRLVSRRPFIGTVTSLVVIASIVGLNYLAPVSLEARLTMNTQSASMFSSGRSDIWAIAWRIFRNNPVVGAGAGAIIRDAPMNVGAHNAFLAIAAEFGVIGLTLYFSAVILIVARALRSQRPTAEKWAVVMTVAIWIAIASTGVWEASIPAWFLFAWIRGSPHTRVPAAQRRSNDQPLALRDLMRSATQTCETLPTTTT